MKLRKVWIENYRSIRTLQIELGSLLALVGPNNVGKSNVLSLLAKVLGKTYPTYTPVTREDFHKGNITEPIKITLRFSDLADEERTYFRARRRGYLRVRGGEPARANYSENLNICLELPFEDSANFYYVGDDLVPLTYGNSASGREISLNREARGYIPRFLLIPGLRDASRYFSDSTKYDWGKLIDTLRSQINANSDVKGVLEALISKVQECEDVRDLNEEVKNHMLEFLTEEHKLTKVSLLPVDPGDLFKAAKLIIDDGFESELGEKGDGLKSLAVIALLLLTSRENENLIVGLEEPELFLHPSALFVLNAAMQNRSLEGQVVYSSHSPFLINVTRPRNIARVYKNSGETQVAQLSLGSHWLTSEGENKVERDIDAQRNLLFFAKVVILVEGPTEYLSLPTFATKMDIDLAKKGIVLVEVNGKPNIKNYLDYLSSFKIPHIVVYDIDDPDASLNQSIESLSAPKVPMDIDFEEMLIQDMGASEVDRLLSQAYGDSYSGYKAHYRIRDLTEEEKVRGFLVKSKPFASKRVAEIITPEQLPDTIQEIVNSAVRLVE